MPGRRKEVITKCNGEKEGGRIDWRRWGLSIYTVQSGQYTQSFQKSRRNHAINREVVIPSALPGPLESTANTTAISSGTQADIYTALSVPGLGPRKGGLAVLGFIEHEGIAGRDISKSGI